MDIFQFTDLMYERLENFKTYWLEQNKQNPEQFPFIIPDNNSGIWWELFEQFQEGENK